MYTLTRRLTIEPSDAHAETHKYIGRQNDTNDRKAGIQKDKQTQTNTGSQRRRQADGETDGWLSK